MKRPGWYGNSYGHSMAARGMHLYARKSTQELVQPLFYAQKNEQVVPTHQLLDDIRSGTTFQQLKSKYPDADSEVLRKKGIKAVDSWGGTRYLQTLDQQTVEQSLADVRMDPGLKFRYLATLESAQKRSFLPAPKDNGFDKVEMLKKRLEESPPEIKLGFGRGL